MLSQSHLRIFKYTMNNPQVTLQKLAQHEQKTTHAIRKDVAHLNYFLPPENQIEITQSEIKATISYSEYTRFVAQLDFNHYMPTQEERLQVIIVKAYFMEVLNLSKLYDHWQISMTTKKRDTKALETLLSQYGLHLRRISGLGIRIGGSILQYRVLVSLILTSCLEVYDFQLARRSANTPIENQIYDLLLTHLHDNFNRAENKCRHFLLEYNLQANYYSKKFFIVYILLSTFPLKETLILEPLLLEPLNLYLFRESRLENVAFNQVASMIDFQPPLAIPHNEALYQLVETLLINLCKQLDVSIFTHDDTLQELYGFIYRAYFYNYFSYLYDDRLVKTTEKEHHDIYQTMKQLITSIESYLNITFHEEQISSMTLIFAKWMMKNRLLNSSKKKIVIVTNVGFERMRYFVEQLHSYINFEHVRTVDINEIELLKEIDHDLILTFSNRISTILEKNNYLPIKVAFFIENQDILKLLEQGCSIASHRLIAQDLVAELAPMNQDDQLQYLKCVYEEIFI